MASEAVRLFVDRASLAAPDLALSPGDAAAVAEICRRADGIPLALELAAAQLRVISPAQLRDLLQDHFRLVSSHRRALPRQLTMHAIIRWSYDQLREDEQALLMALAICSGGCDLQAAAALTSPEMEPSVLLSGLARLADLSLLTVRHGAGNARYFILETVRQFAFERLQERDGAPALRVRHLKHYLELAEACAEEFSCTGEGARPMERIDIERDNLLRAIDACFHDEVPDAVASGLRLVAGLRRYWTARGMANRGAEFSLTALDRAAALSSTATYRSLLGSTVYMLWWSGRLEEALTRALELQRLSELANDRDRLALAHLELGTIHRRLGREDEGQWHFQRARSVALEAGNQCLYGDALVRLGHSALFRGRYEEAQRLYEEAMPARRSSGHGWRIVGVLQYAGVAAVHMSDAARARVYLREASAVLKRIGSVQFDLFMLDFAIALAVLERHWALVARLGGVLQRLQPLKGPPLRLGEGGRRVEDLECARTALGAEAFDDAWRLGLATDLSHALTFIDGWLHGKEAPARLASGLPLEPG
jgi:non-specific serine/threonine protein kinase